MQTTQIDSCMKKLFVATLLNLGYWAAKYKIVLFDNKLPIINLKVNADLFLPIYLVVAIAYGLYALFVFKKIPHKHPLTKYVSAFLLLTLVVNVLLFLNQFFTMHIMLEVMVFGLIGFMCGTIISMSIEGIFYIRTPEERVRKWLPRVPFAIKCIWQLSFRIPYILTIIFLIAINYHCYVYPYNKFWLISFGGMFFIACISLITNLLLLALSYILKNKNIKQKAIDNLKPMSLPMEIHDRQYLLFGHRQVPIYTDSPELVQAVKGNNYKRVKALLASGASPDQQDALGWTALMLSAADNRIKILRLLLSYGADVNIENVYGRTALHFSSRYGHKKVTEILINAGAIIDAGHDTTGQPPLFIAIEYNHVEIVKLLVENKANLLIRNRNGYTPLEYAEHKNNGEIARIIRSQLRQTEPPVLKTYLDKQLEHKKTDSE